jgi:hypothetical protein
VPVRCAHLDHSPRAPVIPMELQITHTFRFVNQICKSELYTQVQTCQTERRKSEDNEREREGDGREPPYLIVTIVNSLRSYTAMILTSQSSDPVDSSLQTMVLPYTGPQFCSQIFVARFRRRTQNELQYLFRRVSMLRQTRLNFIQIIRTK